MEALRARFEILKRDYAIEALKKGNRQREEYRAEKLNCDVGEDERDLDADYDFLADINMGTKFMDKKMLDRLKGIAGRKWILGGDLQSFLSDEEVYNLSIPVGTLTEKEKEIVKNHVTVTHKMLCQLPFPKKLKNVSYYASSHHERIDGAGYPFGLKGDEIPLQARIIALADVFDALTAKDRPYKKDKTLSEAIKIMRYMVNDNHIDRDLFELFIKERIHLDYAKKELTSSQIDMS